jgi:anion-transporting  ArsA/GET3 family ATPase
MNELFGGWRARAEKVRTALRGDEVGYLLVTTPDPMCIREVLFFARRLMEQDMTPDAYVVNRVHRRLGELAEEHDIEQALADRGLDLGEGSTERVLEAARQMQRQAQLDRLHLVALEEMHEDDTADDPALVHVPDFPRDIHDVQRLRWMADVIAPE